MRFFDELAAKIVLLRELRWTLSSFISLGSLSLDPYLVATVGVLDAVAMSGTAIRHHTILFRMNQAQDASKRSPRKG